MRIRSLITAIALFATTVFAVEIVCTSTLIHFPSCGYPPTLLSASVSEDEESLPVEDRVLAVTASFPEDNPFGRKSLYRDLSPTLLRMRHGHTDVINGEMNKLLLSIENRTGKNVTLLSVAGEFLDPSTEQLIKAVCALP